MFATILNQPKCVAIMRSILVLLLIVCLVAGEPLLPKEHREFYLRNHPDAYRTFCDHQQVDDDGHENENQNENQNWNPDGIRNDLNENKNKNQNEIKNEIKKFQIENLERNAKNAGQHLVDGVNCSKPIDDLRCWGYESDRRCRKWSNRYPVQPCE